jgi:hypothetical protein
LTLSTAQSALVSLLTAAIANTTDYPALANVPLAVEAFNADSEPAVDAAMAKEGVCILSIFPWSSRIENVGNGVQRLLISLIVFVLENKTQNLNTANGGLGRNPLLIIEAMWRAITKTPMKGPQRFRLSDPLEPVNEGAGIRIWATNFELESTYVPGI